MELKIGNLSLKMDLLAKKSCLGFFSFRWRREREREERCRYPYLIIYTQYVYIFFSTMKSNLRI